MNRRLVVMWVQDYLRGDATLTDLQERLISLLWGDRTSQPEGTIELAHAAELRIAEYTSALISAEALAEALRDVSGLTVPVFSDVAVAPEFCWESSTPTTTKREAAHA